MIRCEKLTKRYGRNLALNALDLEIADGELHGFVGPNGAGKTTAMKILATLLRPTSGDAFVDGVNICRRTQEARKLVGYMPDFFGVYDNLKAWEYLDFYAGCVNMDAKARRRRIDELLDLTALANRREAYVDSLSRGMKQRLCLARALMHDPKLLILDEPASGMDPRSRSEMRNILKNVGEMGKTVLISSHILPELSELCTSLTILEKGKLVFSGAVSELERKLNHAPLMIRLARPVEEAEFGQAVQAISARYGIAPDTGEALCWLVESEEERAQDAMMLRELIGLGIPVCGFSRERASLEQVFMEVTCCDDQSDF